jgi:hypothetical protein
LVSAVRLETALTDSVGLARFPVLISVPELQRSWMYLEVSTFVVDTKLQKYCCSLPPALGLLRRTLPGPRDIKSRLHCKVQREFSGAFSFLSAESWNEKGICSVDTDLLASFPQC